MRRNFSLVACYSLKFTSCSLLVVKSLVARCRNFSLLVAKLTHYSLQKLLATNFARYLLQKISCEICSLIVAEVARCSHSSLNQSPPGIVCLKSTKLGESFSFFNILYFLRPKNSIQFSCSKSTYYAEICLTQNIT